MAIVPIRIKSASAGNPGVGNPGRELIGFAHRARRKDPTASGRAVLILNPFGQEAVRTHRLLRVTADRLARSGYDVLRFDYFGSGDSPGDDLEADIQGWAQDTIAAHHLLREFSKASHISWLGLRLGASVGLIAAAKLTDPPAQLVLWEPVLDGKAHLSALAADHRRALFSSYSLPAEPTRLQASHEAVWPPTELMGFGVSAAMADQIQNLTGKTLTVNTPAIALLANNSNPNHAQATSPASPASPAHESAWRAECEANGCSFTHHTFDSDFDWTSEEALNTALVPAPAVAAILAAMAGGL